MDVNVHQKRANNDVTVGVKDTDDLYPWSIQPTGERGRFCVYNFQRGYERYFSGNWDECEKYARAKRNAGAG